MKDPQETFRLALEDHQAGDLVSARERYLDVLRAYPEHPDALHLCGMTYYQSGNFAAAEPMLRAAIVLRPQHRDYHANLGLVLMKLGQRDEAVAAFCCALAVDPYCQDALLNLANAYLVDGLVSEAEVALRRLLSINPEHAEANNSLGVILSGYGMFEDSLVAFRDALKFQPDYPDAHANIAQLLAKMGRDPEASEHFERATTLNPDDMKMLRVWGSVLKNMGDYETSLEKYELAVSLAPEDPITLLGLGSLYQTWGKYEQAEQSYYQVLRANPDDEDALNNLGTMHMARDEPKLALSFFQAVLQRRPKQGSALYNSGTALQELGDLGAAKDMFIQALAAQPDLSQAYRCLADIYYLEDEADSALSVLLSWRENMPEDPEPEHLLAAGEQSNVPLRASDAYVKNEFDRFAEGFEKTLSMLDYQAPQLVADILEQQQGFHANGLRVLDAGCGTGLIAPLVMSWCDELVGVDLSPKMVSKAQARNVYDQLVIAELVQFMTESESRYDLIVCVDTLVYFGELRKVLEAASAALVPGGWLGFSVERAAEDYPAGYALTSSGRYTHTEGYLRNILTECGLLVVDIQEGVLRQELIQPVIGFIVAAQKFSGESR